MKSLQIGLIQHHTLNSLTLIYNPKFCIAQVIQQISCNKLIWINIWTLEQLLHCSTLRTNQKSFFLHPVQRMRSLLANFLLCKKKNIFFKYSFHAQQYSQKKLLHNLIKIHHQATGYKIDQNSTDEFDKDSQIDDKIWNQYIENKEKPGFIFINGLIGNLSQESRNKILSIIFYSLCLIPFNYESPFCPTAEKILLRLVKFIKSLGVHSQTPFLYTNYGTGDIAQAFARVASVYGSEFILNDKVKIGKFQFGQWDEMHKPDEESEPVNKQVLLKVKTNLAVKELNFCKGAILTPQVFESYSKNNLEVIHQLRLILISTKDGNLRLSKQDLQDLTGGNKPKGPSIYVIPKMFEYQEHPIYLFRTDNTSNSTHKDYEVFYYKVVIKQEQAEQMVEDLIKLTENYLGQISNFNRKAMILILQTIYAMFVLQFKVSQIKPLNSNKVKTCNQFMTSEDNFEFDLDENSLNFKTRIGMLNKNIDEGFYMVPHPDKAQKFQQQQQEEHQDNVALILNQIEKQIKGKDQQEVEN